VKALDWEQVDPFLKTAIREDLGNNTVGDDITSQAVLAGQKAPIARARLVAKTPGVLAGVCLFRRLSRLMGQTLKFQIHLEDGAKCLPGDSILTLKGPADQILALERTGLNFLQQLSGTATLTAKFVATAKPASPEILDTRKTIPGLRLLQKWAVLLGGGTAHRFGLFDMVLIKENHITIFKKLNPSASLSDLICQVRKEVPGKIIEIELTCLDQLKEVLEVRPDIVMLDNFSQEQAKEAVDFVNSLAEKPFKLEISGGITLDTIQAYANTGVDRISIGALTHSAPALDISLLIEDA